MSTRIRCLQCMQEYDSQFDICPYCGSEREIEPKELYFLRPGAILAGRYEIGASLGDGGFGITYKAWDLTLSKVVAVKEYYPVGLVNRVPGENKVIVYAGRRAKECTVGRQRFLEEARNMARYNTHANIVNVYDFFEENGTAYIVMEFLDGMNYKEYLEGMPEKKVPVQEALTVMEAVLTALSEVHKSGILHRDISPGNIFLCKDGKIKLIDFGAARFSAKDETANVTVILKPGYAPPEQYQSKGRQGPWIDIYAAGATLYHAITGIVPEESVNRNEKDELIPPEKLCPEISHNLNNAILRAMALQPELRFQSAEEFWNALSGESAIRDVGNELKRRKIRRFLSIAAISAAALAGALVCMRIVEQRKAAAAILEEADVTLWVSADSGQTAEEKQEIMEEALQSFREEYPQINVTVTCAEAGEYETRLREAMEEGQLPTLFESSCLWQQDYEYLADLSDVFDFIKSDDCFFLERYADFFPHKKQIPLAFTMPVIYRCILADTDGKSTEELIAEKRFLVTAGGYFTWYNLCSGEEPVSDFVSWLETGEISGILSDQAEFLSLDVPCLLADTSCYRWVQENMPGIYEIEFWQERGLTGAFQDCFSIAEDAKEEEKAAAVQILVYLLADQAQDVQYVQNGDDLPLNKTAYRAYVEINGEFGGLEAEIGKAVMGGEAQALLDRLLSDAEN
ncbi:MAG: serine/threonine-protein kinase [bacterium]|nr:serine/threonine-protein kinase [bacterium]